MEETYDILLVEDSDYDAELTFKALKVKMPSITYLHLRDGEEALSFMFANGAYQSRQDKSLPILIMLDISIPKVNGLEVLKALKSDERTKSIPVVMLTISKDMELMREAYRLGANSFVIKPMSFVKFSLAIAEIGHYWLTVNDHPWRSIDY